MISTTEREPPSPIDKNSNDKIIIGISMLIATKMIRPKSVFASDLAIFKDSLTQG